MYSDEIILEMEGTLITCEKQLLRRNSDYFRAMFEDDFMEKNMSTIKLKGVEPQAMQIILTILSDRTYSLQNEDILIVLQVAWMQQFISVVRLCVNRATQVLCTRNCLKVWLVTEQLPNKTLTLKAKSLALNEFMLVRDTECIQELPLKQLCEYVGNVNLRTDSEFLVFQTLMEWWYINRSHFEKNSTITLLKLLSCINYQNLSPAQIKEIIDYPDISNNNTIKNIMMCLSCLLAGLSTEGFSQSTQNDSRLLYSSESRVPISCPCILVRSVVPAKSPKKIKIDEVRFPEGDKYRQKEHLNAKEPCQTEFHVIYYDVRSNQFKKAFGIDDNKCRNLEGFKLLSYGRLVLMYGGQYIIGCGIFNSNFWTYDFIQEEWDKISPLPSPRRHFESCIADNKVFILGGTGNFRIRQENLYWYNLSQNEWSRIMNLPFSLSQVKCCEFMNEFVVFSINNKCGHFYTRDVCGNWMWMTRNLIIEDEILNDERFFQLVPYKDKLYMKGKKLIEFYLRDGNLVMLSVKNITTLSFDALEVVLCCDTIYTLYRVQDLTTTYSFEKYNLKTGDIEIIFDGREVFNVEGEMFELSSNMKIFPISHYNLFKANNLINCSFL